MNELLQSLRIPGESFMLPSQGIFYAESILDTSAKNGELELYPMTTIDEILITTPDKLLSGKAISEVFAHCIPQVINMFDLFAKDVDFLMVCLRMVSFGQFMDVTYKHTCVDAKDHTYQVDLQKMIKGTKKIDPTTIASEYKCVLSNGQVVLLKPMTYGDMIKLYQNTLSLKNLDSEDVNIDELIANAQAAAELVTATLVSLISSVNNITDVDKIAEWVSVLPIQLKKELQSAISDLGDWGIEMKSVQICKDCKKSIDLHISANPVNFFI